VHQDVVGVDRPQACLSGLEAAVQQLADDLETARERLGTRRAPHAGRDGPALGTDERVVERDDLAGEFRQRLVRREVAGEEGAEGIGPALDGVGHDIREMPAGRTADARQLRHVVALHREADAAPAEQQPERLLEEARTVAVGGGAVVDARVLAQDRVAPELHGALAPKHQPVLHAAFADGQQILDLHPPRREMAAVHVDHPVNRLFKGFTAHLVGKIAAVFRREDIILKRLGAHANPSEMIRRGRPNNPAPDHGKNYRFSNPWEPRTLPMQPNI